MSTITFQTEPLRPIMDTTVPETDPSLDFDPRFWFWLFAGGEARDLFDSLPVEAQRQAVAAVLRLNPPEWVDRFVRDEQARMQSPRGEPTVCVLHRISSRCRVILRGNTVVPVGL